MKTKKTTDKMIAVSVRLSAEDYAMVAKACEATPWRPAYTVTAVTRWQLLTWARSEVQTVTERLERGYPGAFD